MNKIKEQVEALRVALGDKKLSKRLANLTGAVNTEEEQDQDIQQLVNDIGEEGGLLNYLTCYNIDTFPKPTRKKLKKFLQHYNEIYEMLYSEGIYFDYS